MTSSRSRAIFLVSNTFSGGSGLEQHSRVTSSWLRMSARIRSLFLAVDVVVVNGSFVTKPTERIVAPFLSEYSAHPRHVHISWPCSVAKSFGSICLHRKEQRAAENDFLARLQRFFTCPTTISRVRRSLVERRPRVIKDKTPKNTTWLVLDHPLCRTGRVSRAIRKMFEYLFKALLAHAWVHSEPPAIRISSRKAMPHVVTRFQRSTRIL